MRVRRKRSLEHRNTAEIGNKVARTLGQWLSRFPHPTVRDELPMPTKFDLRYTSDP
jgi:hypothetical protein